MAKAQIPDLTSTSSLGSSDEVMVRQGTTDKRIKLQLSEILAWATRNGYNYVGDYTADPELTSTDDFAVYNGLVYFGEDELSYPYSIDYSTYPDPDSDTNLQKVVEANTKTTGGYLENVVEDTTPQLGGDLDVNGNYIYDSAGNVTIDDNLNVTGTATINKIISDTTIVGNTGVYEGSITDAHRVYSIYNNNIGTDSTNYSAGDHVTHQGNLDLGGYYLYDSTDSTGLQILTNEVYVGGIANGAMLNVSTGASSYPGVYCGLKLSPASDSESEVFSIKKRNDLDQIEVTSASASNYLNFDLPIKFSDGARHPIFASATPTYTISSPSSTRYTFYSSSATTITLGSGILDSDYLGVSFEIIIPAASTKTIVNSTGLSLYHISEDGTSTVITTGSSFTAGAYNKFILNTATGDYNVIVSQ